MMKSKYQKMLEGVQLEINKIEELNFYKVTSEIAIGEQIKVTESVLERNSSKLCSHLSEESRYNNIGEKNPGFGVSENDRPFIYLPSYDIIDSNNDLAKKAYRIGAFFHELGHAHDYCRENGFVRRSLKEPVDAVDCEFYAHKFAIDQMKKRNLTHLIQLYKHFFLDSEIDNKPSDDAHRKAAEKILESMSNSFTIQQ